MAQEETAEELLVRVAARDESALRALYDRFAPRLLALLSRILPERQAAKEVLQEVFGRLWNESRRSTHERASVAAWLVFTARIAAIDRLRAQRGLPPLARRNSGVPANISAGLPPPEQIALLEQRRELLKKVINQLPSHQRHALELAVFDGYTEAEIAQALGETLGKVRTELRAAMRFLRHRLRAVLGTWAANI